MASPPQCGAVSTWTTGDVARWAVSVHAPQRAADALQAQDVDGEVLLHADDADVRTVLDGVCTVGARTKLLLALHRLRAAEGVRPPWGTVPAIIAPPARRTSPRTPLRRLSAAAAAAATTTTTDDGSVSEEGRVVTPSPPSTPTQACRVRRPRRSSVLKVCVAALYFYSSIVCTSITMVLVQERIPDPNKYPPLPDIVLDNIPFIPWAFRAAESIGLLLLAMLGLLLVFHASRMAIVWRGLAIAGTLFYLRCCTMIVTSLSVPTVDPACPAGVELTMDERVARITEILLGFGMSLNGVKTCGDLVFSGHTVVITHLSMLLTEYTPHSWRGFHTCCVLLNVAGVYLILSAREHYALDCLIALYLTVKTGKHYHSLLQLETLAGDGYSGLHIIRTWNPIYNFLESDTPHDDRVNMYDVPACCRRSRSQARSRSRHTRGRVTAGRGSRRQRRRARLKSE